MEVGIFRSPLEFVELCKTLQHPFDGSSSLEDDLKRNIFRLLTQGPEYVAEQRELVFKHYEAMAVDLSARESHLHAAMCPEREKLVCNKKFLLFQQMARDAEVSDDGLLDLLISGVPLAAQLQRQGNSLKMWCPQQ